MSKVTVVVPPVASADEEMDLVNLTEFIHKSRFPDEPYGYGLGGPYGYGIEFENDTFEMHPFWWGELHLRCRGRRGVKSAPRTNLPIRDAQLPSQGERAGGPLVQVDRALDAVGKVVWPDRVARHLRPVRCVGRARRPRGVSTILGPAPCHTCRAHVWVVRRTVEVHCRCKRWEPDVSDVAAALSDWACSDVHVIPRAAWTVVDESGERHRCVTP